MQTLKPNVSKTDEKCQKNVRETSQFCNYRVGTQFTVCFNVEDLSTTGHLMVKLLSFDESINTN